MSGESPFLVDEELALFAQPNRFHRRQVVKKPLDQTKSDSAPEELSSMVVSGLNAIIRKQARSFYCHCVSVRIDDGMSWAAESVRQRVIADCPQFAVVGLGKKEDPKIPQVTRLIGERRFLQAAVKHKLTKWYLTLYLSQASLVIAGFGAVGVLAAIANAVLKMYTPATIAGASQLKSPVFLAIAAAVTILGTISKVWSDRLAPGQKEASIKLLKDQLNEHEKQAAEHQPSKQYTDFIEELARALQWVQQPRVVIVDNYERLDPTSRAVIEQYFRVHRKNANGSEYWLILELPDGQGLSHVIEIEGERYELDKFDFFRQIPLSPKSIQELAQVLNLKEFPPGSTVKWICHGGMLENGERTVKLLDEYRRDHPVNDEQYGDLEFYYLLSAASIPAVITFRRRDILSALIQRGQRSQILKLLLPNTKIGTDYAQSEFDRKLTNIQKEFNQFLESTSEGELTFLHEPARILEDRAESFGLQDSGLVHLYWSLFWFDGCRNQAPQAYLLRKLRCHVLKANVEKVPSPHLQAIVSQVFDALIYTIENSLKTCLFSELPNLVEKAANFYGMKDLQERKKSLDKLLRPCWDVYSVLGDERILSTILQLQEIRPNPAADIADPGPRTLTELFLQAVPMDDESRNSLRTGFRNWTGRIHENGEAARRNADAFAGWFITGMAPLIPRTWVDGNLLESALDDRALLPACFRESTARINRQKTNVPMLTDVMTLSMCLWAVALRMNDEFSPDQIGLLTDMAEEALILATELRGRTAGPHMEVVVNALSRELSAVALASLLTGFRSAMKAHEVTPEWQARALKLVKDGLDLFGERIRNPGVEPDLASGKLIAEIDALLSLCALVWIRFGLDRLRDFAYLRRAQFNFIGRAIAPDDHGRAQPLLEPVSLALAERGATGVLSNCIVAGCFRLANDLSARYLNWATHLVLDGEFGSKLQNEMSIILIYHGHVLPISLDRPLKILLARDPEGKTFLRKFLLRLPNQLIDSYALRFLNVAGEVRNQDDADEVEGAVAEAAALMAIESERAGLISLLQLHRLKRRAYHGDPLPPKGEILNEWSDRKQSWMFARVILILIEKGHLEDEDWQIAHSLLQRDPATDETTSYFSLSMTLTEHGDEGKPTPQQRNAALRYLHQSITRWETLMPAETNLRAYQLLARHDEPNLHLHYSGLMKWQQIKIERDHLEHLRLVKEKKYFLIFHEYFDSAKYWGLMSDASREQWREFQRADTIKRKEFIREWVERGAVVPAPLSGPQRSIVSTEFLWVGYRLFSPPFYDDPVFEDHRKDFNKAAKDALRDLSEAILRLPDLPSEIHALLAYYNRQLLSFAGLADDNTKRVA